MFAAAHKNPGEIQMARATTVKAFVCKKKKKKDEKINLLLCYFLNDAVDVTGLGFRRLMSAEPVWLNERFFKEASQRTVRKRWIQTGEGEKRERTI